MSEEIAFDIIIPTFPVADVNASVRFYTEKLGFELTHKEGDEYAHVVRGEAVIALYKYKNLQQRTGCEKFVNPTPTRASIFVVGLTAIHAEFTANGVTILDPPTEVPYGWDMQIVDNEGHVLEFIEFRQA